MTPGPFTAQIQRAIAALLRGAYTFNQIVVGVGTGAATAGVGGTAFTNTTAAQTGANTNETDLWTDSIPANTLSTDGYAIRIRAWGTTAANANSKNQRLYFGGTVIGLINGSSSGAVWNFDAVIVRTDAAAQVAHAIGQLGGYATGSSNTHTPLTADTTAAIPIKITGQNGVASAGDIVFRGVIVEVLIPAP